MFSAAIRRRFVPGVGQGLQQDGTRLTGPRASPDCGDATGVRRPL